MDAIVTTDATDAGRAPQARPGLAPAGRAQSSNDTASAAHESAPERHGDHAAHPTRADHERAETAETHEDPGAEDEYGSIHQRPITILIADDHALVREGTRRLLEAEPDMVVVAEAGDGQAAIEQALATRPDVAIMDVAMPPGMNGIEATRRIKAQAPRIAVLAVTAYDDDQYVMALLDAGAAGFLLKDVRGVDLISAVRAVARGEAVLQPTIAVRALKRAVNYQAPVALPPPLSEREMQVLQEAARGLPNKDIARRMDLSVRTVHTHLGNIFAKLGVGSRTEAVLLALRRGWVSLHDTEIPGAEGTHAPATTTEGHQSEP